MALTRSNPIGIQATGQIQLNLTEQLRRLHKNIEDADRAREPWLSKQRKLLEQRLGIRRKTTFPWPGAANESWPLTDSVIRRWKPAMVRLVLGADPVAFFAATEPDDLVAAATAQLYYHWKFHKIPNVHRTVFELVDKIAQYGVAYTAQGWEYRTDKTARIVRTDSLFPGGVAESHQALVQQMAAQAEQMEVEPPPAPSPVDFVRETLLFQYGLEEETEGDQIAAATQAIVDGAPTIKLFYEEVVADRPSWKVIDPTRVIRPARGDDIGTDDFVVVTHDFTPDELRRMVRDQTLLPEPVVEILRKRQSDLDPNSLAFPEEDRGVEASSERDMIQQVLDTADGISAAEATVPVKERVWQIHTKIDVDGDGLLERVMLWYHPSSKTLLSGIDFVFPFKEWPLIEFSFEHTSDRPFSARGIPEHLFSHQKVRNRMHNARLDSVAITLSPMFQAKTTVGSALRNIRPRPGLMIPVQNMGDIQPLPTDVRPLQFLLQEENITSAQAEQYIGIFDPGVLAQNTPERRTATEVGAITSVTDSVFSADAILFQRSMAAVHRQLWLLILEFGPDEEFFRVTGEAIPRVARRGELDRDFDIAPAGTPETTSRAIALRNAEQALQLALQDQSQALNLPAIYRYFFDLLDRNLSKVAVRPDAEVQILNQLLAALAACQQQQLQ